MKRVNQMGRKGIAFFLAIMMLLGGMPLTAGAEGGNTAKEAWWEELPNPSDWPASWEGTMVYDPGSGKVIALIREPQIPEGTRYPTYEWDGSKWTKLPIEEPEGTMESARLVYIPDHGVFMYGGKYSSDRNEPISTIWKLDQGSGWIRQVTSEVYDPRYRTDAMVTNDPSGGVMLFGGAYWANTVKNETWVWDPATSLWTDHTDTGGNNPPARTVGSMVYDPANGNVLLFGGLDANYNLLGDTWLWNGSEWQDVTDEVYESPEPRSGASISYNPNDGRILLFGGQGIDDQENMIYYDDLWAWDGSTKQWNRLAEHTENLPGPSGRTGAHLIQDDAGNLILFGGQNESNLTDMWRWDGRAWEEILPSAPQERFSSVMATDSARNQVVMFGGLDFQFQPQGDTWVWNGEKWIPKTPFISPPPRGMASISYDGKGVLLFGGESFSDGLTVYNDTWRWDGESWDEVSLSGEKPTPRAGAAMAYFPTHNRVVLYGGSSGEEELSDMWAWDGEAWNPILISENAPSPSRRVAASFSFDGNKLLLFGGASMDGRLYPQQDTWLFDGERWEEVRISDPTKIPPARYGAHLTYDPSTGRTFLFGGITLLEGDEVPLNDLWVWDPEKREWNCLDPGDEAQMTRPGQRGFAGMAYSPNNRGLLLFGGASATSFFSPPLQDTWLLHTSDWLKLAGLTLSADRQVIQTGETTRVTGQVYGKDGLGLSNIPVTLEVYNGGGGLGDAISVTQIVYSGAGGTYSTTYTAPDAAGAVTIKASIAGTELAAQVAINVQRAPDHGGNPPGGGSESSSGKMEDHTAPTGSIIINDGAGTTNTCEVTLTLTASDTGSGVKEMRFSPDGKTWTAWEPYATMKRYTLTPIAGQKQVYVQFRDVAGNMSTPYSDEIFSRGCCQKAPVIPPLFTDISGHWAEEEINRGAAEGIVKGDPDGTFHADRSIKRSEFIVMLANALCLPEGTMKLPFRDTGEVPDWAKDAVIRAYEAGLIKGYPDGTLRLDREITRSELIVILVRAFNLPKKEGDLSKFSDYGEIGQWALDELSTAIAHQLLKGRSDTILAPNEKTTRAESVVLILRALTGK